MKDPESPLAPRLLRRVVASAALLCAPVAFEVALLAFLFGGSPGTVLGAVLLLLGAVPTAWAAWTGSLRHGLKAAGTLVFAAGLAAALIVGVALALEAWRGREPFAYPATDAALMLGFAAAVAVGGALLAASVLRRPRGRPVALAALGLAAVLAALALATPLAPGGCRTFQLDTARWRAALEWDQRGVSDAERIADAVARCGVLADKDRREVRRLLGPPNTDPDVEGRAGPTDSWFTGEINDAIGPGDAGDLTVVYDQAGRVTAVDPPTD